MVTLSPGQWQCGAYSLCPKKSAHLAFRGVNQFYVWLDLYQHLLYLKIGDEGSIFFLVDVCGCVLHSFSFFCSQTIHGQFKEVRKARPRRQLDIKGNLLESLIIGNNYFSINLVNSYVVEVWYDLTAIHPCRKDNAKAVSLFHIPIPKLWFSHRFVRLHKLWLWSKKNHLKVSCFLI